MGDYLPKFKPGQAVTFSATTAVTGGRVVVPTGDRAIGHAAADAPNAVGVAAQDTKAGESVTVFWGGVQRLVADGPIAVGARVSTAAAGRVASAGTNKIGTALTAATAQNDVVDVQIG